MIEQEDNILKKKIALAKEELTSSEFPFYDFCDKYILEDNIQNFLFNQKYNMPGLLWIFINPETGKKTRALTMDLLEAIDTRIMNNSHIVFFIYGPTNSGKSELAIALAKYYQHRFWRLKKNITIHLTFSDSDIDLIISKLGIGDLTVRDESSIVTGEGSNILQIRVTNLIRVVRAHQNSFIFINPDIVKVPLVDYYLETAGKLSVHICTKCEKEYINYPVKIHPICPECGCELILDYPKCKIRAILYDKDQFPIGRIYLPLITDQEFRQKYEDLKFENIKKLKITSGLVPVAINDDKLTREKQIILDLCLKNNIDTKIGMKALLHQYNMLLSEDEKDMQIGGTEQYNDLLFEMIKQILDKLNNGGLVEESIIIEEKKKKEQEQEEDLIKKFKDFNFPYTYRDILEKAKKQAKFRNIERDFEIYFKVQQGIIYEDIIPEYQNLTDKSSITKIVQKVRSLIGYVTGYLFENTFAKYLETIYPYKINKSESVPGKPDIHVIVEELIELHIFSCKCLDLGDKYKYVPIKSIKAELNFAWDNRFDYKKVRLFLIVLNSSMQEILVKEITDFNRTENINFS